MHSELSDYIQNHRVSLPDFDGNGYDEDSDELEEEFQSLYANSVAFGTNASEIFDNWLFRKVGQRDCVNGSTNSVASASSPVGMLVPSPTQDCPPLIGNRIVDEVSDLSENGSDTGSLHNADGISDEQSDSERSKAFDLPHVLVESKTLIGGKNEMSSFERSKAALIDLLEPDSLVSEQSLTGQSPAISEAKNNLILIEDRSSPKHESIAKMNIFSKNNNKRDTGSRCSDLLIKFDSLEPHDGQMLSARPMNDIERFTEIERNMVNGKHDSGQFVNRFTGRSYEQCFEQMHILMS